MGSSDCPKKNALPEYQQARLHGNGSSRIFCAGRV